MVNGRIIPQSITLHKRSYQHLTKTLAWIFLKTQGEYENNTAWYSIHKQLSISWQISLKFPKPQGKYENNTAWILVYIGLHWSTLPTWLWLNGRQDLRMCYNILSRVWAFLEKSHSYVRNLSLEFRPSQLFFLPSQLFGSLLTNDLVSPRNAF